MRALFFLDGAITLQYMTQQTVPVLLLLFALNWLFVYVQPVVLAFFLGLSASLMTLASGRVPEDRLHRPMAQSIIIAAAVWALLAHSYEWLLSAAGKRTENAWMPIAIVSTLWDVFWVKTQPQLVLKTGVMWTLRVLYHYQQDMSEEVMMQLTLGTAMLWSAAVYLFYNARQKKLE